MSSRNFAAPKAFTPPVFGDFGKKAKDLFKKKYDFENQVVLKNTVPGVDIETSVVAANDAPLRGVFKSKINVEKFGKANGVFESEFHTVAEKESKTSYKLTNLYQGLGVKATLVGVKPEVKGETPAFPEGWAAVETTYTQEYLTGKLQVRSNTQKTLVDAEVALGYDRISVGGKVTVDANSKQAPTDYDFGAEILGDNYVASAVTEKKRSALKVSYFQTVNKLQTVGAEATFGLQKPTRTLAFGTSYQVDIDTSARAFVKVDSSKDSSVLALAVEHRLSDNNILVGVATEYNVSPSAVSAGKFGVTVTLGDL